MIWGEQKPVQGKCNARLYVGDNYGDNHATMLCQLEPKHQGDHRETWQSSDSGQVTITWEREDPQIALEELCQEVEKRVIEGTDDEVFTSLEYLIEQDISAVKLYCGERAGERAVFFRVESPSEIWVSIGSMGAGESLPKDRAIAKLIAGLKGH